MFVILELVEAGARGRKQNDIARRSTFAGASESVFERLRALNFGRALNLRLDLGGRGSNRIDAFHSPPQQLIEHRVVAALVLAAKNQMNIRRKRLDRLNGCVDVGGL